MYVAPSFVSISIDLLFQTFSMAFSAAVAFASLVRTYLMLSRVYVVLLPMYMNCSTFSKCLPSINNFPVGSFSPKNCLCFFKVHVEPIPLALLIQCPCYFFQSLGVLFYQVYIIVPLISPLPRSLSLILSSILSNTSMKVFGDIGSLGLVPLLVANHSPSSFPILTAAVAFPFISLGSRVNFLSTPYEPMLCFDLCYQRLY